MSGGFIKIVSTVLLSAAMLAGCQNDEDRSEFLGRWVGGEEGGIVIQIEQNADGYLVRETRPRMVGNKIANKTVVLNATVIGGGLQIPGEIVMRQLLIDHTTGKLSDGENDYTRAK